MLAAAMLSIRLVGPAADPTAGLELAWDAPASCPDAGSVRDGVARLLASVGASGDPRVLQVHAAVREVDGSWHADLRMRQGTEEHERALQGDTCDDVTEAAVLIVAMTLEPAVASAPQREEPVVPAAPTQTTTTAETEVEPVAVPPEPRPIPEAAPREPSPEPAPRDRSLRFGASVDGGAGFGPLPRASGVLALALGVRARWWRADATAGYWTPARGGTSSNPDVQVRAQLWHLGARGCGVPRAGRIEAPLCLGIAAGLMHAIGVGDLVQTRARSPWAAVTGGATLVVRVLPWLGIRVGVEGHVAFARPEFHTEPSGRVFRAGGGGIAGLFGLDFEVP